MIEPIRWSGGDQAERKHVNVHTLCIFDAVETILAQWDPNLPKSYNPEHELRMRGDLLAIVNDYRNNLATRTAAGKLGLRMMEEAAKFGAHRCDRRWDDLDSFTLASEHRLRER